MNVKACAFACLMATACIAGLAQEPAAGDPRGAGPKHRGAPELMADNFFSPDLIMENQKALKLSADQQTAIRAEMQKTMARFTDLKWQESAADEALDGLLKQERVDEKRALAQLDKLLAIENDVKRLHFGMLVRVKNLLTREQQRQLRELKKYEQPAAPPRDPNPGTGAQGGRPRPQPPQ